MYYANTNQKKVGEAILISDRAVFRARKIRDKGEPYMVIKVQFSKKAQPSLMCMHLTTEHQNMWVKADRNARRNKWVYSHSWCAVALSSLQLRELHSPPDSSACGIFLARILEWVDMPSSRGSSWPRDWTHVSCIFCAAGRFFTLSCQRPQQLSNRNSFSRQKISQDIAEFGNTINQVYVIDI